MRKVKIDPELIKNMDPWMNMFDNQFNQMSVELFDRPFYATHELINNAFEEIINSTKEEQLKPPWFVYWYKHVEYWYEEKYGDAINKRKEKKIKSFTIINDFIYSLKIPYTLSEKSEEPGCSWLVFPNEMYDYENPLIWIENSPKKDSIEKIELEKLYTDLKEKSKWLRNIKINILISTTDNEIKNNMFRDIIDHLNIFSDDIIRNYKMGLTNSIWELNFAVEKSLKLNLMCKNINFPRTHEIKKLFQIFKEHNDINKAKLEYLPNGKNAIRYRYGEIIEKDLQRINKMYREALEIIDFAIENIEREIKMKNGRFLIKSPFYGGE